MAADWRAPWKERVNKYECIACMTLLAVAFLVTVLVLCGETHTAGMGVDSGAVGREAPAGPAFTRQDVNRLLSAATWITLAVLAVHLLLHLPGFRERTSWAHWGSRAVFATLLITAAASTFLATFQYALTRERYFDVGDTFHYYLGPKYFHELGYTDFYVAAGTALKELQLPLPRYIRDLQLNQIASTYRLLTEEASAQVKRRFSSARWEAFKRDIETYRSWDGDRSLHHRMTDHGYNGTPVWNFFAAPLAMHVDVTHRNLTILSLINLWMLTGMLCLILLAFGWELGLLFTILCWVNIADRYLLGGAFLRYFWLACLGAGLSLMKMKRYAASAVFLTWAGLLRIFPLLFLGGIGVKAFFAFAHQRPIPTAYRRFICASAVTAVYLISMSLLSGQGAEGWKGFARQMEINSGRLANGRIGFVYNFLYPKDIWVQDGEPDFRPIRTRFEEVHGLYFSWKNLHLALAALLTVGLIRVAAKLDDVETTVCVGFGLFFLLFSTVRYYYAGLVGLPLLWHARMGKVEARVALAYLFLVMAVGYHLYDRVTHGFLHNTLLSGSLTLYLCGALLYLRYGHATVTTLVSSSASSSDPSVPDR